MGAVKTTLELPDDLFRAVKVRAASEGRKLKDVVAELIRRGLEGQPAGGGRPPGRVQLPLVQCAHPEDPADEMTAERVAEILGREEARTATAR
jgi:hypothetical protein